MTAAPFSHHAGRSLRTVAVFLFLCLCGLPRAEAFLFFSNEAEWRVVPAEQLAMREPEVDPEAGVEILLHDVEVDDDGENVTRIRTYVRMKVFNERGLQASRDILLRDFPNVEIERLAARTIQPDGSTVELNNGEIYEKETGAYAGEGTIQVKAFTFPGLVVGSIIEFQYESVIKRRHATNLMSALDFEFPCHLARISILPSSSFPSSMLWYNFGEDAKISKDPDGRREVVVENLNPFPKVDFSPPKLEFIPWWSLNYSVLRSGGDSSRSFWELRARQLHSSGYEEMKVDRSIRQATGDLLEGAKDDRDKLSRIYHFVQNRITNLKVDTSGYTPDELEDLKHNRNASDVMENGYGNSNDVRMLFGAMCRAAGFEAEYARSTNRSVMLFFPERELDMALPDRLVAVKVAGNWEFFDPGDRYMPFGMLNWRNAAVPALLAGMEKAEYARTQSNPPDAHVLGRSAELTLQADGTLEGEVELQLSGYFALRYRHLYDGKTAEEIREHVTRSFFQEVTRAVITEARTDNLEQLDQPFIVRCHISVPEYADSTGNRMFVNPSFFARYDKVMLKEEDEERTVFIHFRYPHLIRDSVNLALPDEYALENPKRPQSLGDMKVIEHRVNIGQLPDKRIGYRRELSVKVALLEETYFGQVREFYSRLTGVDQYILNLHKKE